MNKYKFQVWTVLSREKIGNRIKSRTGSRERYILAPNLSIAKIITSILTSSYIGKWKFKPIRHNWIGDKEAYIKYCLNDREIELYELEKDISFKHFFMDRIHYPKEGENIDGS